MEGSCQSEFLNSDELGRHSKLGKLPTFKVREKKYLLYDPAEEKVLLDKFFSIHEQVLNRKKVARIKDLMHADWDDRLKRAVTDQIKGKITQHMGYSADGKFYFTPEETAFLIEIGSLELCHGKMPLSAEEAYALVLSEPLSVEKYLVYSSLSRSGYVVVKHNKELNVCTPERMYDYVPENQSFEAGNECDIDDSRSSCSSNGSHDENIGEEITALVSSVTSSVKVITPPQVVDGVSSVNISENIDTEENIPCQGESEDRCSETVVVDDVSDGTRSSSCISKTLNESSDATAEHLSDLNFRCAPLAEVGGDSVESHVMSHDENKVKLMFDDDSLGSGKLVIIEQEEMEIDVADSANDELPEKNNICNSNANNHATSYITTEVANESVSSTGDVVDSSNSNTVNELSGEKDRPDSVNSDEEINVERISPVEGECDEQSASSERKLTDQKNSAGNVQMSPIYKSDEDEGSVNKDVEKSNSADEIIDVEQIDSSDDEPVRSKKEATQDSESSDESSDESSPVVWDSSDDSSDSEDSDKGSAAEKNVNSKKPAAEQGKDFNVSLGSSNSGNTGNEVDDSEIVFIEVKPKESKPLAVIDLSSGSDSEEDNSKNDLLVTADDDDVLIIGEESASIEMQDRQAKRHLTKKEKKESLSTEKKQEALPPKKAPLEWLFPNFAGRTVVCLPRPPSHLLPPNVRPNKEVYPIDTVMFSRSNGSFEKQGFRRDRNSDWRNRSFDNYNVPIYKRQYRRPDAQRGKPSYSNNYTDQSTSSVFERNKGTRSDDDSHGRSKKKFKDQMTPHPAHSVHYRDATNYGNQEEIDGSDQGRIQDKLEDDRVWAHSILSSHLDRSIPGQNSNDESDVLKRRYEDQRQRQQFSHSSNSRISFRSNSHWRPIEEFDDCNSRVSSTSKSDCYRALMMESQKFDSSIRDMRFSSRFSDSRFPLDLRPDAGRNLHLRHDEVSSSSSPVYMESRDFSPHRQQHYHSLMQHSPQREQYNQRQFENSRPYERPCEDFGMENREWNKSNHVEDSMRRDSPYTDVLNLCVQQNSCSSNLQDCVQPSSFHVHQKSHAEQHGRVDSFYVQQNRSVQNLNSEWNEGNKMVTTPVEFSFRAERAHASALERASPRLLENTYDGSDANYHNKAEQSRKFSRLDSSVSERRNIVVWNSSSEVGSPHHVGNPELTRGNNSRDGLRLSNSPLPASLLEMIETAKNPSSHQPTFDGNMLNEEHSSKRKYNEMAAPASSFSVDQNVNRPTDFCNEAQSSGNKNSFISLQTPNLHSSSYANKENDSVVAPNDVSEVDCSDLRDYPHKRRVVIEGASGLSIHARSNTNSEAQERTFDQHSERFSESRVRWEGGRTNFRGRDANRFEGDRWRGGNQKRWPHRPQRYQGGSYHHRRQHHGPTKATYYPSAIEKLPDRISSWSEYWSTLKRLENPEGVTPSENSVPVDEILWSKDIQPLVKPGTQYPVADVLSSLRITQCLNLIKMENLCDRFLPRTCSMEISFDVYLPGTKYSKKAPGTPSHRIVVTRSTDPFPKLAEVVALQKKFSDMALLQFAVINCGEIAFYSFNDISLPTLLPLEDAD